MSDYIGVRCRGTVEVKKWCGAGGFSKDVNSPEEGAIMHDLVVMYSNPEAMDEVGVKRLNIQKLGLRVQEEDPALASLGEPLHIDKEFLIDFVRKNPLNRDGTDSKAQAKSMKEQIVDLTPRAIKGLKEWIAREHSSLAAGRQRKDLDQIHPPVLEDGVLELRKKIQDLKAEITFLKEVKKAEIISLKKAKETEIMSLKEAHEAEIMSLKEAYDAAVKTTDAALKAMNAAQEGRDIVMEELYSVHQAAQAASVTPFKPGVAVREEYPQNESNPVSDSWMEHMNWTTISRHYSTDHN